MLLIILYFRLSRPMSPMPEYSDEDLSPTQIKPLANGLTNTRISVIIEENGTNDNNDYQKNVQVSSSNEQSNSDNQNGGLNPEVGVELTESVNIVEVSINNKFRFLIF